jgi:hypothetical protein
MDNNELDVWAGILLGVGLGMLILYFTIKAAIISAYDYIKNQEREGQQ